MNMKIGDTVWFYKVDCDEDDLRKINITIEVLWGKLISYDDKISCIQIPRLFFNKLIFVENKRVFSGCGGLKDDENSMRFALNKLLAPIREVAK